MIYLDYAATTPMSATARDVYTSVAERFFGNSSSLHDAGSEAKSVLESSRSILAGICNVSERGLYFTGSGSEANFLAIVSLANAHREKGHHLITTEVEHSSVTNTFSWLEKQGFEVTRIGVNRDGRVNTDELEKVIRPDTILLSIQHANSETGTLQDLKAIGEIAKKNKLLFHSDCVQTFCKLQIDPKAWNLDAFSVSAHKVHGPKGLGAAWIDPKTDWKPFIEAASQERRFRPGTVDVPAVASFAAAAREFWPQRNSYMAKMEKLRILFIDELAPLTKEHILAEGSNTHRLPNILGLRITNMEGQFAMLECSQQGIGISTGSACQVNEQKPSPSLLAMGYDEHDARQFIRCSFGNGNTEDEIKKAAAVLKQVTEKHSNFVKS